MNQFFKRKEPPFILVILLSAMAWITSHTVTRTIEQPIIELKHEIVQSSSRIMSCSQQTIPMGTTSETHRYRISNLSRDELFRNISLFIRAETGSVLGVTRKPVTPAFSSPRAPGCDTGFASIERLTLHPGWQFLIEVVSTPDSELDVRLQSAMSAVKLKNENIETLFVRHVSSIFLSLFGLLLSISAIYLTTLFRDKDQ